MFNTYEEMLGLKSKGLAKSKVQGDLEIFKYSRKVMYDYVWKSEPKLLECRGHTYDTTTGEIVVRAPRKTFNYLEDGEGADIPLSTQCKVYRKYNGYMLCVTPHKGKLIWSTTGSLSSDYVKFAQEKFKDHWVIQNIAKNDSIVNCTYLFEVVDFKFDPHIVNDENDLHYLGVRFADGRYEPSHCSRVIYYVTLGCVLQMVKTDRSEGFMVYPEGYPCMKVKTPYYIGKKKLMRMTNGNAGRVLESLKDSELFGDVLNFVKLNVNKFIELPEQDRRNFIENIIG